MLSVIKRNRFYVPPLLNQPAAIAGTTEYALDTSAARIVSLVFQVPKSGTITRLGIRFGTITLVDPFDIGLCVIDASGDPDVTTAYGGMTAGVMTPAATDDNTWLEALLAVPCTAVAGDIVALYCKIPTWTDGNLTFLANNGAMVNGLPYTDRYATSWTKNTNHLIAYVKYSDGYYESIGVATCIMANEAPASNTVPDEVGIEIISPIKFRAAGFYAFLDADAGCQVVLYNDSGTALATVTLTDPADVRGSNAVNLYHQLFASPVMIHAGSPYYLVVKPTTVTAVNLPVAEYPSAAVMADLADFGDRIHKVSRTDAGSWAHDFTKRPRLGFIAG